MNLGMKLVALWHLPLVILGLAQISAQDHKDGTFHGEETLGQRVHQISEERLEGYRLEAESRAERTELEGRIASLQRELELEKRRMGDLSEPLQREEAAIAELERQGEASDRREWRAPILEQLRESASDLRDTFRKEGIDRVRREQVEALIAELDNPRTSALEAARQLWSFYLAELERSEGLERVEGVVPLGDGGERAVDFLRVGGVVWLYRAKSGDRDRYGAAREKEGGIHWQVLTGADLEAAEQAFAMSERRRPPGFLNLPLTRTEVSSASQKAAGEGSR